MNVIDKSLRPLCNYTLKKEQVTGLNVFLRIATFVTFVTFGMSSAYADCSSNNEPECLGYWNIYASIKGGNRWSNDKVGSDSLAQSIERQATVILNKLNSCRIRAQLLNSSWFIGMAPDLLIVVTGSFENIQSANQELSLAKNCGIQGYSKKATLTVPGPGED